jgi:hypothetical protein
MELEIRYGTGWASDGLAIHPADKADECSGTGKDVENVLFLVSEFSSSYLYETHVIGAGVEA